MVKHWVWSNGTKSEDLLMKESCVFVVGRVLEEMISSLWWICWASGVRVACRQPRLGERVLHGERVLRHYPHHPVSCSSLVAAMTWGKQWWPVQLLWDGEPWLRLRQQLSCPALVWSGFLRWQSRPKRGLLRKMAFGGFSTTEKARSKLSPPLPVLFPYPFCPFLVWTKFLPLHFSCISMCCPHCNSWLRAVRKFV